MSAEQEPLNAEGHAHIFVSGRNRCYLCGMSIEEVRASERDRMLTEAFNRLASVLERLEAKL